MTGQHARRYSRIRERRGAKAATSYKPRHRGLSRREDVAKTRKIKVARHSLGTITTIEGSRQSSSSIPRAVAEAQYGQRSDR